VSSSDTSHARLLGLLLLATSLATERLAAAATFPQPKQADAVLANFHFDSGETLPELKIHYRVLGEPQKDSKGQVTNAVLILHGTTGSGANFINDMFAGELFGPGQPLDAQRYFIVIPDGIGHGDSSKPSDGLHAKFPHYGYGDMVAAQYRLLTETLGVNHLRLVMGTSMGGMHTWLWGERHPGFMDALLPLASLPVEIAGRNRMWRRLAMDTITSDPGWNGGEYKTQPAGLRTVESLLLFMSNNPVERQKDLPTRAAADDWLEQESAKRAAAADANDVLYALDASHDYDPAPKLGDIAAPLLAINFGDDLINPPELGLLEAGIKSVPHGRALVIPRSDKTRGHGTHTMAAIWKDQLVELLQQSERH
jgi:homoserine O-acetyltransferase